MGLKLGLLAFASYKGYIEKTIAPKGLDCISIFTAAERPHQYIMSEKTHYTNRPDTLSVESGPASEARRFYTVAANVEETEAGWSADVNSFWEHPDKVDEADMRTNPAKYLDYIPTWRLHDMQKHYTDAVQSWMDTAAQERGYDNIHTAASYENSSVPKFKAEGQACRQWRDEVWTACYEYLAAVLSGEAEVVTIEELISQLPQLTWPNV